MIKLIVVSVSLLLWYSSFSQSFSKYFVEISAGPSIPVGSFAEKKYNTDNTPVSGDQPGVAKTGVGLAVTMGRHLDEHLGVMVMIDGAKNKQDAESIREALAQKYPGYNVTVATNKWTTLNVLAGIFLHDQLIPETKKLTWQIRALGGINATTRPAISYIIFNPAQGGAEVRENKRKLPVVFAFAVGAGLEYALNPKWYLSLNSNYRHAIPCYKFNYNPNFPDPGSEEIKEKYPVRSISVLAGVGIRW